MTRIECVLHCRAGLPGTVLVKSGVTSNSERRVEARGAMAQLFGELPAFAGIAMA